MGDAAIFSGSSALASRSRRRFVLGASAAAALAALPPMGRALAAGSRPGPNTLSGPEIALSIGYQKVNFTGRERVATVVNEGLPGPLLRWREGERITLRVTNQLDRPSSIHWHGAILPEQMDGVPGLGGFAGIAPGETFKYEFDVTQSGTYWYHSHSGFQEQTGLYGPLIVEPAEPDPVRCDREHVVLLSDWTDEDPRRLYARLKKESHYYNFQARTVGDLWEDIKNKGVIQSWKDRAMWNQMRMSDADLADVTGYTYTYLMNGVTPDTGWAGLFEPGERVRLRFVNAAAMTAFDVRIPGLRMTVVAADGQNVKPVAVDEFRIATAETYDVIVEPKEAGAFSLFAQSSDRSGFARGTLSSDPSLSAPVPGMEPAPRLSHADMGMNHGSHEAGGLHSGHDAAGPAVDHRGQSMATQNAEREHPAGHEVADPQASHTVGSSHGSHGSHSSQQASGSGELGRAGLGSTLAGAQAVKHAESEFGPHVDMRVDMPVDGLHDPGPGLREHESRYGRRVLTYADLRSLGPTRDRRQPTREIQLHLTGNMGRYMWSIDGLSHDETHPILLAFGERVRFVLINDTMMAHPIHLHGMWSELETGDPGHIPRKHTVLVQPASAVSYLVTADAEGDWAYHCHLLYHMPGMMRTVRVLPPEGGSRPEQEHDQQNGSGRHGVTDIHEQHEASGGDRHDHSNH